MKTITLLVGLPCSGKTYYGKSLGHPFVDDVSVSGAGVLKKLLGEPEIVVSDVFLCRKYDREFATRWLKEVAPDYELKWVFFENNPEKCLANMKCRMQSGDVRQVATMITQLSKQYEIPEGVEPKLIWEVK
jgi:hypothetical protein